MMRLLFVCDFRSPTAKNWVSQFRTPGNEIHVVSTYPVETISEESFKVHSLPIAFAHLAPKHSPATSSLKQQGLTISPKQKHVRKMIMGARDWVAPIEIRRHVQKGQDLVRSIDPDLVHALRIPYEGMFAGLITPPHIPLLVSIWGLDLELQAVQNPIVSRLTKSTLKRVDGLLADCHRDIRISADWGYDLTKPTVVVPGAGGVNQDIFYPGDPAPDLRERWNIPDGARVILNPRGFREYVRMYELMDAFPLVLDKYPDAVLVAPGFEGVAPVKRRLEDLGITKSVRLGPVVSQQELADLFRLAEISVSPSTHDGTPNSLLETMASGCFPVVGDIESIREWITHRQNGLLCDSMDPSSIGSELISALGDPHLRSTARSANLDIIQNRASRGAVSTTSTNFYQQFVSGAD